jgi:hypothetical protein
MSAERASDAGSDPIQKICPLCPNLVKAPNCNFSHNLEKAPLLNLKSYTNVPACTRAEPKMVTR